MEMMEAHCGDQKWIGKKHIETYRMIVSLLLECTAFDQMVCHIIADFTIIEADDFFEA